MRLTLVPDDSKSNQHHLKGLCPVQEGPRRRKLTRLPKGPWKEMALSDKSNGC